MSVLVIYSHSYQANSRAGRTILGELVKQPNVTIRNLEELYPEGNIDVQAEQEALLKADTIVFAHPTFWYNVPPMLKKWQDEVLAYGFAYGPGAQLGGKRFIHSYTTGATAEAYAGGREAAIELPQQALASFAGLEYVGAVGTFGFVYTASDDDAVQMAQDHARRLIALL